LFDAASALLGVCAVSDYEGQAAMMLESRVSEMRALESGWRIEDNQLNFLPLFSALLQCDMAEGANLFHGTLVAGLVEWVKQAAGDKGLQHILLSGGCFLNKVMSEGVIAQLKQVQLIPLYPSRYPPNDGGISLGQAWVAGNKQRERG